MAYYLAMNNSVFDRIVEKVGTQADLARAMGLKPQAILKWKRQVPADRVLAVEALTGISRHEIRPDVFGEPDAAA